MNRIRQIKKRNTFPLTAITFLILSSAVVTGSDFEKISSREQAAATEYAIGVKHIDRSRQILILGDSAFAYNYRATSAAKAKKEYEKAVKRFQKAIEHKADFVEAFDALGFCLKELGDSGGALQMFQKALAIDEDYAPAHKHLGEMYLAVNDLKKANQQLDILIGLHSPYADSLASAIELYKLEDFSQKLERSKRE